MNLGQTVQPVAERFPAEEEQEVELTFFAPDAQGVQVAGTFNDWQPERTPLERAEDGEWKVKLKLKAGQYEYRFLADGTWRDDPRSTQWAVNPYGGLNSVLRIGLDDRTDFL